MTVYELLHNSSINKTKDHLLKINPNDENRREDVESFLEMILSYKNIIPSNYIITETYECTKTKGLFYYSEIFAFHPDNPQEKYEIYTLPLETVLGAKVDKECFSNVDREMFIVDVLNELI